MKRSKSSSTKNLNANKKKLKRKKRKKSKKSKKSLLNTSETPSQLGYSLQTSIDVVDPNFDEIDENIRNKVSLSEFSQLRDEKNYSSSSSSNSSNENDSENEDFEAAEEYIDEPTSIDFTNKKYNQRYTKSAYEFKGNNNGNNETFSYNLDHDTRNKNFNEKTLNIERLKNLNLN